MFAKLCFILLVYVEIIYTVKGKYSYITFIKGMLIFLASKTQHGL